MNRSHFMSLFAAATLFTITLYPMAVEVEQAQSAEIRSSMATDFGNPEQFVHLFLENPVSFNHLISCLPKDIDRLLAQYVLRDERIKKFLRKKANGALVECLSNCTLRQAVLIKCIIETHCLHAHIQQQNQNSIDQSQASYNDMTKPVDKLMDDIFKKNLFKKNKDSDYSLVILFIIKAILYIPTLIKRMNQKMPHSMQIWKTELFFDFNRLPHLQADYDSLPEPVQAALDRYVIKSS